jgi:hypothetical protein
MAEFYSYVERQAGNQIDWSKIGSDVTKTLNEVVDLREKKKAAIDEETNKNLETLQNAPKGEDTDVNGWTINAANDLTQGLLLQNRLLKSGKSSVKDYTLYMANTKSGTTQAFNVANEYQKQFSLKMERMKSQDPATRSQALEWTSMGYLEGFGKLSDSKLIQDPLTGQISVGMMETNSDGVRVLTPKVMAVNDLYKSVAQKYDYFDSKAATGGVAKVLADVVRTEIKAGGIGTKGEIITTEDALQKPNTAKALEDGVNSFLTNPYNISSVLTEDLGTYNPVYSEDELKLDPERNFLVRVDKSGTFKPEFSDKQKKAAKDYLIEMTKAQVEDKIKKEVFQSAAVDKEQLSIARKNAEQALRAGLKTTDEENYYEPFKKKIEEVLNNSIKADGRIDPAALGSFGYTVKNIGGGNVELYKTITTATGKQNITVAKVPFSQNTREDIKNAIIVDYSKNKEGVDKIKGLYESGQLELNSGGSASDFN